MEHLLYKLIIVQKLFIILCLLCSNNLKHERINLKCTPSKSLGLRRKGLSGRGNGRVL